MLSRQSRVSTLADPNDGGFAIHAGCWVAVFVWSISTTCGCQPNAREAPRVTKPVAGQPQEKQSAPSESLSATELLTQVLERESSTPAEIKAATDQLVADGQQSVPVLIELLGNKSKDVQAHASGALLKIGAIAVPALIAATSREETESGCTITLHMMGAKALPGLEGALESDDLSIRLKSAGILVMLERLLKQKEPSAVIRHLPSLIEALDQDSLGAHDGIVFGELGKQGTDALVTALGHRSLVVRRNAARLSALQDPITPELWSAIQLAAADKDAELRIAAMATQVILRAPRGENVKKILDEQIRKMVLPPRGETTLEGLVEAAENHWRIGERILTLDQLDSAFALARNKDPLIWKSLSRPYFGWNLAASKPEQVEVALLTALGQSYFNAAPPVERTRFHIDYALACRRAGMAGQAIKLLSTAMQGPEGAPEDPKLIPLQVRAARLQGQIWSSQSEQDLAKNDRALAEKDHELSEGCFWLAKKLSSIEPGWEARYQADSPKAVAWSQRAIKEWDAGQRARALTTLKESLSLFEETRGAESHTVAQSRLLLGTWHAQLNDPRSAIVEWERAFSIFDKTSEVNSETLAGCLSVLAGIYIKQESNLDRAEALLLRAYRIYSRADETAEETANTLRILGEFYTSLGRFAEAEFYLDRGIAVVEQHPEPKFTDIAALLRVKRATLFLSKGQPIHVEQDLMAVSETIGKVAVRPEHWQLQWAMQLAMAKCLMGDVAEAVKLLEKARKTKRPAPLPTEIAEFEIAAFEGYLRSITGDFQTADQLMNSALNGSLASDRSDPTMTMQIRNLLAVSALAQSNSREAKIQSDAVVRALEGLTGPLASDVAVQMMNCGVILWQLDHEAAAEKYIERACAALNQGGNSALVRFNSALVLGAMRAARHRATESLSAFHDGEEAWTEYASDNLFRMAASEHHDFLALFRPLIFDLALSIAAREPLGAESKELAASVVLNGKFLAARALAEQNAVGRDTEPVDQGGTLWSELVQLRHQIAGVALDDKSDDKQLLRLLGRENSIAVEYARGQAKNRRMRGRASLGEVRARIPAESVLIEIARFKKWSGRFKGGFPEWDGEHYAAIVVPSQKAGEITIEDLGSVAEIDQAVMEMRQTMTSFAQLLNDRQGEGITPAEEQKSEQRIKANLAVLAKQILRPIEAKLEQSRVWIVSPDSMTWLIPWSALPTQDGSYVIERHTIAHIESGCELVRPAFGMKAKGAPLIVTTPQYGTSKVQSGDINPLHSWRDLPDGGMKEIVPALKAFSGGLEPVLKTGTEASERSFEVLERPWAVIVDTHGFAFEEAPPTSIANSSLFLMKGWNVAQDRRKAGNRSFRPSSPLLKCGLVLAGANDGLKNGADDGILSGLEILGLDLRGTKLVLLSACDTAVGVVHTGEGLASLSMAFRLAGAESVVSTLWQIPTQETIPLTQEFLRHSGDGVPLASALRQAQLSLILQRRKMRAAAHPFYWAAFSISGVDDDLIKAARN